MIVSAVRLARDRASRGDLKIANAALEGDAVRVLGVRAVPRRRARPRSSARRARRRDDPLYDADRRARRASSPPPTGW